MHAGFGNSLIPIIVKTVDDTPIVLSDRVNFKLQNDKELSNVNLGYSVFLRYWATPVLTEYVRARGAKSKGACSSLERDK